MASVNKVGPTSQTADVFLPGHTPGGVAGEYMGARGAHPASQAADLVPSGYIDIYQAHSTNHRRSDLAEQPNVVLALTPDKQVLDGVPVALEGSLANQIQ